MTPTLFIIQIVLTVIITITVLLQKSSSIGLGAYSGSNESVFGAKGPAGFLTKLTFIVALLLIVNTLALGYFYTKSHNKSVVDNIEVTSTPAQTPTVPNTPVNTEAPSVPAQ